MSAIGRWIAVGLKSFQNMRKESRMPSEELKKVVAKVGQLQKQISHLTEQNRELQKRVVLQSQKSHRLYDAVLKIQRNQKAP